MPSHKPPFARQSPPQRMPKGWRQGGLLIVASLLSACATGPRFSAVEPPPDSHALVYIYREHGVFGLAMRPDIWVDGQQVGDLPAGGYLRVEVPLASGPRRVFVGGRRCSPLRSRAEAPGAIHLTPGSTFYVQLDIETGSQAQGERYVWNNSCRLQVAEPGKALAALAKLKLAS